VELLTIRLSPSPISKVCSLLSLHRDPISLLRLKCLLFRTMARCKKKRRACYSLRSIILFADIDVSRHILIIDTSVLVKNIMGRREYMIFMVLTNFAARPYMLDVLRMIVLSVPYKPGSLTLLWVEKFPRKKMSSE
jgi:hypothetical protein